VTPGLVAAVLVAGAIGAVARWLVSRAFASNGPLPLAVLVVNVAGSAIGGAIYALSSAGALPHGLTLVLLTGLCGGLTTFSTFSVETVQLVLSGRPRQAVASVAANLLLSVAAASAVYVVVTLLV
jgi:CrcB protein